MKKKSLVVVLGLSLLTSQSFAAHSCEEARSETVRRLDRLEIDARDLGDVQRELAQASQRLDSLGQNINVPQVDLRRLAQVLERVQDQIQDSKNNLFNVRVLLKEIIAQGDQGSRARAENALQNCLEPADKDASGAKTALDQVKNRLSAIGNNLDNDLGNLRRLRPALERQSENLVEVSRHVSSLSRVLEIGLQDAQRDVNEVALTCSRP